MAAYAPGRRATQQAVDSMENQEAPAGPSDGDSFESTTTRDKTQQQALLLLERNTA